jgi:hypothetical protein
MKNNLDDIDFDRPGGSRASMPALQHWDILAIIVLIVTACMGAYFLLVFINPNTPLNPLSQKNYDDSLPDTPTFTPIGLEPTWTPSATPYIPPTDTARPTFTPVFTSTVFSLVPPTKTPIPTATPKAPYSVTVEYIASSKYRPEFGCNWLGVAGTVLDKKNAPVTYMQLLLLGTLNGESINNFSMTGLLPLIYGPGGFELDLGRVPIASKGTLFLQLKDQGGVQLSENVYINTYTDCSKNMVFIRFKENK